MTSTEENTGTNQSGGSTPGFDEAQQELFRECGIEPRSRFVDLDDSLGRTHVFEAGPRDTETPLVFVHGTAAFGAFLSPLIAEFRDEHVMAFDRPGYGLSDPFTYTRENLHPSCVTSLHGVLNEVGVGRADVVGHSMGGQTAVKFALQHPDHVRNLFLVGSVPAFPGTKPPLPIRVLTTPLLGRLMQQLQKPGKEGVLDIAEIFGEREAIQRYPALIRAIAAHEEAPKSAQAGVSEFRALVSTRGWRRSNVITREELQRIQNPTTVIWGENDPLGKPGDVREGIHSIPNASLETVDSGHIPFLAHPRKCAQIIRDAR